MLRLNIVKRPSVESILRTLGFAYESVLNASSVELLVVRAEGRSLPNTLQHMKRYVAKVFNVHDMYNSEREGVARELKASQDLRDLSNVVQLKASFQMDGYVILIYDYCEQGDIFTKLASSSRTNTSVPESTIYQWVYDLAKGLKGIHTRGYLHNDLKSANLFLNQGGALVIGDFGSACRILPATSVPSTPVPPHIIIPGGSHHCDIPLLCEQQGNPMYFDMGNYRGTPGFSSPELIHHSRRNHYPTLSGNSANSGLRSSFSNMRNVQKPGRRSPEESDERESPQSLDQIYNMCNYGSTTIRDAKMLRDRNKIIRYCIQKDSSTNKKYSDNSLLQNVLVSDELSSVSTEEGTHASPLAETSSNKENNVGEILHSVYEALRQQHEQEYELEYQSNIEKGQYAPFENGYQPLSAKSDVYSVGAFIMEAVSLQTPRLVRTPSVLSVSAAPSPQPFSPHHPPPFSPCLQTYASNPTNSRICASRDTSVFFNGDAAQQQMMEILNSVDCSPSNDRPKTLTQFLKATREVLLATSDSSGNNNYSSNNSAKMANVSTPRTTVAAGGISAVSTSCGTRHCGVDDLDFAATWAYEVDELFDNRGSNPCFTPYGHQAVMSPRDHQSMNSSPSNQNGAPRSVLRQRDVSFSFDKPENDSKSGGISRTKPPPLLIPSTQASFESCRNGSSFVSSAAIDLVGQDFRCDSLQALAAQCLNEDPIKRPCVSQLEKTCLLWSRSSGDVDFSQYTGK